jgi:CHAT domain-containing protein/Flp pilus assembly protein TadD
MRPGTAIHGALVCLCVLLSFVFAVSALDTSSTREQATQLATAANDNAFSFNERQGALTSLQESVTLFLSIGENLEAARVLTRVGRLQLLLNEAAASITTHRQALDLLKDITAVEIEIDNLNGLAAAYLHLEKFDDAKAPTQQAILLSQQSGYVAGEAQALLELSQLKNNEGHDLALETAKQSLALWQTLNDKAGQARAYLHIGQYQQAQQMLDDSARSFEAALSLSTELNNRPIQAEALLNLGFIDARRGEWQGAIDHYTGAQKLLDEHAEPEMMGGISAGLAHAFIESGSPEIGLKHYERAIEYFRLTGEPSGVQYGTLELGHTNYLLGNFEEATNLLEKLLDELEPTGVYAATSHEYLGCVFLSTGDYDAALQHLRSALPIYRKKVNPKEEAQVLGLMGRVYQQQGNVEQARQYYEQALEIFTRLSDRVNLAGMYFSLGRLELSQDNLDTAEAHLRKSIDVTENMRRVSMSTDLTAAFSGTVHDRYATYMECLMRKHRTQPGQRFDVRAFEMSEMSRGRALVELLQSSQTPLAPGLDPQLAEQEKSLRQALRLKANAKISLLAGAYKKEQLTAIDGEISQLETEYTQLRETIRARYPSFDQLNRPNGWDLNQIQQTVVADDDTVLLEYSLGTDRSYVWAVTRDGFTSHELPTETVINAAAQKVYRLSATQPTEQSAIELEQAAQELSRMVLLPVAANLNKRRILLVADGALNYIPFQSLPPPSGNDERLLTAYEVINAPSASILGQLRQETGRRHPATNLVAAFGAPMFASSFAQTPNNDSLQATLRDIELTGDSFDPFAIKPLLYAKHELANLREVAGAETFLATGFNATRELLQRTDLTKYSILHFATHGFLNPKSPERSGLVLSTVNRNGQMQDGFVGLNDIYNLRAPVDLVVLSACQTGLGKDVRGEGLIGITRGFMYAGASSVVASLWKVDDEATAELMKNFYSNMLERGMTPAAALRAAQSSIRNQKRWRAPYYWAAFTIQGDYRGTINTSRIGAGHAYETSLVFGALLVLTMIVAWSYRGHRREMAKARS